MTLAEGLQDLHFWSGVFIGHQNNNQSNINDTVYYSWEWLTISRYTPWMKKTSGSCKGIDLRFRERLVGCPPRPFGIAAHGRECLDIERRNITAKDSATAVTTKYSYMCVYIYCVNIWYRVRGLSERVGERERLGQFTSGWKLDRLFLLYTLYLSNLKLRIGVFVIFGRRHSSNFIWLDLPLKLGEIIKISLKISFCRPFCRPLDSAGLTRETVWRCKHRKIAKLCVFV